MASNFPNSPVAGVTTHTVGDKTWLYVDGAWKLQGGSGGGGAATQQSVAVPKTAIAEGAGATLQYKSEPQLVNCADGTVLCVYRKGSGHINNDGILAARRSTDQGATWSAEWTVYDAASGYDTRNPTVGIDPASGRIVVFGRVYNATTSTQTDLFYVTSTDHGATFSAATSLTASVTGTLCPYGVPVNTSLGMVMSFYAENKCSLLVSTDGGATWGGEVVIYSLTQTPKFNEPMLCAIDDDRVVLILRDDNTKTQFAAYRSGNGGATWTYMGVSTFTTATVATAAPLWAVKIPGTDEVAVSYAVRHTLNRLYYVRMAAQSFWEDPALAWIFVSTYPVERKRALATALRRFGTVTTGSDLEFGYPCLLPIPGATDRLLIAWYDSGDGTNVNASCYVATTPAY